MARSIHVSASSRRRGFTLVELMVTLVIIGILSSLMLSGLLVARDSQKRARTAATIRKLSEIILPYYETYETRRPTIPPAPALPTADMRELRRAALRRVIALELPERPADVPKFPIRPDELPADAILSWKSSNGVTVPLQEVPPAARRYRRLIDAAEQIWSGPGDFRAHSGELLHMIVMRGPVADPGAIIHFRPDEIGDTDNDGLPEFLDGWGRPILFRRWPVGFVSPVQPIDGSLAGIDDMISNSGHRLVPLIYSAGSNGWYDIEVADDFNYRACNYEPFNYVPAGGSDEDGVMNFLTPQGLRGEVVLTSQLVAGQRTFTSHRIGPDVPMPSGAFQTIGSERRVDGEGNGYVGSIDNVHNHDMTR